MSSLASVQWNDQSKYAQLNRNLPTEVQGFIKIVDAAHNPGKMDHIHFKNGKVLRKDGSWSEDNGCKLPQAVLIFLKTINFEPPKNNDTRPNFTDITFEHKSYTDDEIKRIARQSLPSTMRKIDYAHPGFSQDHIHFKRDERGVEAVYAKDGTWHTPLTRSITLEELNFITKLDWPAPKRKRSQTQHYSA